MTTFTCLNSGRSIDAPTAQEAVRALFGDAYRASLPRPATEKDGRTVWCSVIHPRSGDGDAPDSLLWDRREAR